MCLDGHTTINNTHKKQNDKMKLIDPLKENRMSVAAKVSRYSSEHRSNRA